MLAEWTGLEPATPGVTGRYSNQLNYRSNKTLRAALYYMLLLVTTLYYLLLGKTGGR